MIGVVLAAVSLTEAVAMIASVAPATPLAPNGKWQVEYAKGMCVLSHNFGDGKTLTSIGFRPLPLGEQTEVAIFSPGRISEARSGRGHIAILASGRNAKNVQGDYVAFAAARGNATITRLDVKEGTTALLENVGTLSFVAGRQDITVRIPPTTPALAALRTCQDDLLEGWGIDPAERDKVAPPSANASKSSLADWLSAIDYPGQALEDGAEGAVVILWSIGTDGRAHDCRIVSSSGSPALDQTACAAILQRARYTPSYDKDGKPMVTHAMTRIKWRL